MRDIWAKGTQSQLDLWSSNIVQVAHELRQPLNHQRQMPIKYLAEDANRQSLRESSLESQIAFCSSQGRDLYGVWWWFSRQVMSDSHFLMDCSLPGSSVHGILPGKNTGVGCHFLLQGIFLTQGSKPSLLRCRWILHPLSHQGSPGFCPGVIKN